MKTREKNKKTLTNAGISLIELIVVIAIMAILVGFLAPNLIQYIEKSKRQVDVTNTNELVESANRVLAANDQLTCKIDKEYMMLMAWNETSLKSDAENKDQDENQNIETNIYKELEKDIGTLPVSKYKKDWFFVMSINADDFTVRKIYLVKSLNDKKGYELYPDYSEFLEKAQMVDVKYY